MFNIGGSKLSDNRSRVESWFRKENPGPLVVEVAVAGGCNHNCIHCAPQQFKRFNEVDYSLNPTAFMKFLDDFRELGGQEVFFAGNGEPALNPMLPEFIRHGRDLGLDMALSTNGVLLTEESIERIIPSVKWIRFSVNGGNAATYAKIHRCSEIDFNTLVANMHYAVEVRNRNAHPATLLIQFLVYELNLDSVPDILAVHHTVNTDLLRFKRAYFKGTGNPAAEQRILDVMHGINESESVQVLWKTFVDSGSERTWTKCWGIHFRTNMDDKGNMFTCQGKVFFDCTYGNIHEKSFAEIWNSDRKKEIFAQVEWCGNNVLCRKGCGSTFDNLYVETFFEEMLYG